MPLSTLPKTTSSRVHTSWWRQNMGSLLIVAGILVLIYPVWATMWNNHEQEVQAHRAVSSVKHIDHTRLEKILAAARAYNKVPARGPILDPWIEHYVPHTIQWHTYLHQLPGPDELMGSIIIPSIGVDLPIYHGTSDSVLRRGVGHLFGTSLPVGGPSTHAVLTAHSGLGAASMFDELPSLKNGAVFYINVFGQRLKYQVTSSQVVLPTQVSSLRVKPGQDLVTLITCTPYGINTHRLLVHAHRVPLNKADHATNLGNAWLWQTWMWIPLVLIFLALALLIWEQKRRRAKKFSSLVHRHTGAYSHT